MSFLRNSQLLPSLPCWPRLWCFIALGIFAVVPPYPSGQSWGWALTWHPQPLGVFGQGGCTAGADPDSGSPESWGRPKAGWDNLPQQLGVLWGGGAAGLAPSSVSHGILECSGLGGAVKLTWFQPSSPSTRPGCSILALNTCRDPGGFIPAAGRLSLGGFVLSLVLSPGGEDDSDPLHPPKAGWVHGVVPVL